MKRRATGRIKWKTRGRKRRTVREWIRRTTRGRRQVKGGSGYHLDGVFEEN